MSDRSVFLAELDDDYLDLTGISDRDIQRRLRCYLLLAPSIVVHPAYIWQSRRGHDLVLGSMSSTFHSSSVKFSLGDSPSVEEYMNQRVSTVTRVGLRRTPEAESYLSWGTDLRTEARGVDDLFPNRRPLVLEEGRDAKFRRLLVRDLSSKPTAGVSLREIVGAFCLDLGDGRSVRVVRGLRGFVTSSGLVSVDSVREYLARAGLGPLSADPVFRRRLLSLYYSANVDSSQVVGGASLLDPHDPVIHPYDHTLFWSVFGAMFGKSLSAFLSDDTAGESLDIVLRLRKDSSWKLFAQEYSRMRARGDELLRAQAGELAREFEIRAEYAQLKVLPRVWRESKVELASVLGGLLAAGAGLTPVTWYSVVGALTSAIGALFTVRKVAEYRDEKEEHYIQRLRVTLKRQMRMVMRRRYELRILGSRPNIV